MKSSARITTLLLPLLAAFSIMMSGGCDEDKAWKAADSSAGETIVTLVIVDLMKTFTVGGNLSGVAVVTEVTLQNNGADDLILTSDGSFQFNTPLHRNDSYNVTTPTSGCNVANGSGTIVNSNITNIIVNCPAP